MSRISQKKTAISHAPSADLCDRQRLRALPTFASGQFHGMLDRSRLDADEASITVRLQVGEGRALDRPWVPDDRIGKAHAAHGGGAPCTQVQPNFTRCIKIDAIYLIAKRYCWCSVDPLRTVRRRVGVAPPVNPVTVAAARSSTAK